MDKKEEAITQAVSPWDTLPKDVKNYILKFLDLVSLQSLHQTRKLDGELVSRAIDNFLRTVAAPTLLRELPVYVAEPRPEIVGDEGLPARSEVLKFQNLARLFNHQTRWQGFTTMEAGVLALMTVPLNQLEPNAVRCIAFNENNYFESEFVETEVERLSRSRVEEFVDKIMAHRQITDEVSARYLRAFAVMVLRATDDFFVQDCIVDLYCVTDDNFRDPLLYLFQYADKHNHRRILDILAWLSNKNIEELGETLRNTDYRGNQDVMMKLLYLIAQPGCFVQGKAFTVDNQCMYSLIYNPLIATNYTLWSLACLYQSWGKAVCVYNTLVSHALILLRMWNPDLNVMTELEKYFQHSFSPAFVNLSEIFLRPSLELWSLYSGASSLICSNLYGVKFVDWTAENSQGMWNLSIKRCMMNNVEFVNQHVLGVSLEKMNIYDFNGKGAQFIHCKFDHINLRGASSFERAEFLSSVFRDCKVSASVNFKGCHFSFASPLRGEEKASPVLFERCLFEGTDLREISGIANCRFINCQFPKGAKLPEGMKGMRCYETTNKNTDSIEGAYELFKLLEASQDHEMIRHITLTLKKSLESLDRFETKFTIEQAVILRLIFRNDPKALESFEKCHYEIIDFPRSAYALLKRLDPVEHAEMLECFYAEVLYIASSTFKDFCTLDEEILCHEIASSDPITLQKYEAMNIRAFDTIEYAYGLFEELRRAGDDKKIRYLQAQLLSTIAALPKKAMLSTQDEKCREIFGYQFSRGMSFINTVTRGLVATPNALQEYEKLNVTRTWEGYVNKPFKNW